MTDYHLQSCCNSKVTRRHNIVKRCLQAAARSVGLEVADEPHVTYHPSAGGKDRADIAIRGLGNELVVDVTVVHPNAGNGAGNVANVDRVTRKKNNKYQPHMLAHQQFIVASMEYFGACGDGLQWILSALKDHGVKSARFSDSAAEFVFCNKWYGRLSMALRRASAQGMLDNIRRINI